MSKLVLVTGANGHIGYNLAQTLVRRGYQVRGLVRPLSSSEKIAPLRDLDVEVFEGNILDPETLKEAVKGVQGIFHTAAPHVPWAADPENEIVRPYVEGTLSILKLAKEFAVKRVILTSSCAAMGFDSELPLQESDWNSDPITPLVQAKVRMEKLAWEFAKENQIDLISFCAPFVIGPGFHRLTPTTEVFSQMLQGTLPPVPEGGCHFLDARDLAEAQVGAYETPQAQGRYVVAGQYLKISELLTFVKKLDPTLKLPSVQLPLWALHLFRPMDWLGHVLLGRPRKLTGKLIQEFLGRYQRVSTEKAERELQWKARPFEETVLDTFAWIQNFKKPPSLWLGPKGFDLAFFHLSGLLCLLLLIPYLTHGDAVLFPIYNFYLVFFGIPHNYLSWATLLPSSARKTFHMRPIYGAAVICLIISVLVFATEGSRANDWVLSLIAYLSLWHAYRQHHGICKIYDTIQAKRTGDASIFEDRKFLNIFFAFALNGVLVWAFTHSEIRYLLSADESYDLIHPTLSHSVFNVYLVLTIGLGILAFRQSVWNRWKNGKWIPWPQISLMVIAILTYIVPYFFIPLSAMPLAVAIGTIYHNVQYFGFVWLFEKYRTKEMTELGVPLQLPQQWVYQNAWAKYFSVALIYSFSMIVFYAVTPRHIGMSVIYFITVAHYVIDGYLWKGTHNRLLRPVLRRISDYEAA